MPEKDDGKSRGVSGWIVWVAGIIGALALLITNVGSLRHAWCDNIGLFCGPAQEETAGVDAGMITVESGGADAPRSDNCKLHETESCIRPTKTGRRLVVGSARFIVSERSGGVFLDGGPVNANPTGTSNIGWYIKQDKNSPDQICANVFARTGACETKVYLKGHLHGEETTRGQ